MWNIVEDLKYGKIREKYVVKYLNENIYLDDNMVLYENEKKQVDFRNKEVVGELKSRTCNYQYYKETFFGYNKIQYLINENDQRVWKFYFFFMDGLYVWTYNKDQYEVRDYEHRERGWIKQVYIPVKYLECLSRKIKNTKDISKLM
tara:strand:+ start:399 stop:836 length:438 start_codon:yes stop_codon:yes gene_type:complete